MLTPVLLNPGMPAFANSEDPDKKQLIWIYTVIQYVNLSLESWFSNPVARQLKVNVAPSFIQHDKG